MVVVWGFLGVEGGGGGELVGGVIFSGMGEEDITVSILEFLKERKNNCIRYMCCHKYLSVIYLLSGYSVYILYCQPMEIKVPIFLNYISQNDNIMLSDMLATLFVTSRF